MVRALYFLVVCCVLRKVPFVLRTLRSAVGLEGSTSLPGGNQVDGLPPASSRKINAPWDE